MIVMIQSIRLMNTKLWNETMWLYFTDIVENIAETCQRYF